MFPDFKAITEATYSFYKSLPAEVQTLFGNVLKIIGIVIGSPISIEFLLVYQNPGVNLVGFCFLTSFVFMFIGIMVSTFLILTGNLN